MHISGISNALFAASATSVEAGSLANQVGIQMLDKSLDMTETLSSGMIQMMEQSVNPHIGSNLDLSV